MAGEYEFDRIEEALKEQPLDRALHLRRLELARDLGREPSLVLGLLHESASRLNDPYFMRVLAEALEAAGRSFGQGSYYEEALFWYRRAAGSDPALAAELPAREERIESILRQERRRQQEAQMRACQSLLEVLEPGDEEQASRKERLAERLEQLDLEQDVGAELKRLYHALGDLFLSSHGVEFDQARKEIEDSLRRQRLNPPPSEPRRPPPWKPPDEETSDD